MSNNKTHCRYGHPLSGDNLRIKHRKRGDMTWIERECKQCHAADTRINRGMKRLRATEARLEAMG